MTKLIIQIPCYNEEQTLGEVLDELPRALPGVDCIEWLVIDDGSTDRTSEVAREHGVDHVVRLPHNQGLARAFAAGLDACVRLGADVVVNTDADHQYRAADLPALIEPVLAGRAEMVVGTRPIDEIQEFSPTKRLLQKLGSRVVRLASNTDVRDAPSGFRAFSREAAMRLNVFNEYTYTLETIIQAGQKGMQIESVPVRTNPARRPSRLVKSIPSYLRQSIMTIFRIFMTYRPFRFFALPGAACLLVGFSLGIRFLVFYIMGHGGGHVQSVILGSLLVGMGFFLVVVGLLADLISVNRKLLEKIDWRLREVESQTRQLRQSSDTAQRVPELEDYSQRF